MGRFRPSSFVIALLGLLVASSARGDTVVLRNGDVITGTVLKNTFEVVVIKHPDLGEITISASLVVSVTISDEGTEVEQDPAAAEGPVPPEPGEPDTTEPVAAPQGPVEPRESDTSGDSDSALDDEEQKSLLIEDDDPWRFSFVLGGSLTNNDEGEKFNINTRFLATHLIPRSETTFDVNYLLKIEEGAVTDNKLSAIADQAWLNIEDPWLYFARARYDYNEFQGWQQRLQLHGGVGYRFYTTDRFRFSGRIGAGGRKDFGSIDAPLRAEGWLGGYFTVRRVEQSRFELGVTYYPALGNENYRVVTAADWTVGLSKRGSLSLNTNLEWDYSTDPDPGFPPNTVRLTFGLQFDL